MDSATIDRKAFLATGMTAMLSACSPKQRDEDKSKDWIWEFANVFYVERNVREAFQRFVAEGYIQHSNGIENGRDAAISVLEPMFLRENFSATPIRILTDRNLAAIFVEIKFGEDVRALVVDIFRFQDKTMVEHWDLKTEVSPENAPQFFSKLRT